GGRRKAYYAATRAEASAKLNAALHDRDLGLPIVAEKQTVGAYLTSWLAASKHQVKPRTHQRYSELLRVHAIPALGRTLLARLSPQQVQALYATKLDAGLSPTTVHHLHAVLRTAIGYAERQRLVPRNVVALTTPPRIRRTEMRTLTAEQAQAFLAAANGDRLQALYVLAMSSGMRQGELLALRWADVDLDRASLRVRATLQKTSEGFTFAEPKTSRSRRQIALAPMAVSSLRAHKARQAEDRLRAGAAWRDLDLVFANQNGGPLQKGNLLAKSFAPLLRRAGLPRFRFHDLRHTAASLLLARGVPVKVVSEMLGHASIAITLDTYAHILPDMQAQAAREMEAILGG
ncbi:MAG TPA: tyrosine-type recombinase/integrase, partial [Ktedonobacterales bacterium]|nr:tyrosine-type recombinase/integrase [Ktedonobacterales bacterium]